MSKKILKLNEALKEEVGKIIFKEMEFPKGVLVTITRAETSSDCSTAKIWFSVIPQEYSKKVFIILNKCVSYIQSNLYKVLKTQRMPRICFVEEKQAEEAAKVEKILKEIGEK